MTRPAGRLAAAAALATAFGVAAAVPAQADQSHRVEPGDTASRLAQRYGSTVDAIVAANNLDSRATLYAGTTVVIPSKESSTATRPGSHTVSSGETLSGIALRYGTTVAAIARANGIADPSLIRIGQRLTLPGGGAGAAATTSAAQSATVHTVVAGDTLSDIAQRYRSTVAAIARANSLANASLIHIGQRLTIPEAGAARDAGAGSTASTASTTSTTATSSTVHTVGSGDTLSAIAQRHGTTVAAIAKANSLANASIIHVGQRLTIPGSSAAPTGLVGDTFLGRTYPKDVVAAANVNKAALNATDVPSRAAMQQLIVDTARAYGVDPALAQAIAYQESGFNMRAVSPANAIGAMQVIPSSGEWASDMAGRPIDLLDPEDNVLAGVLILRSLTRTFDRLDHAIAGYYQGAAAVKRHGLYDDTVDYVAAVRAHMARFA
jgi:LysM repeat protein